MNKKNKVSDNFELLKEDFEVKFCKKWDEDPDLYLRFYHARVMDALLLLFSTKFSKGFREEAESEKQVKNDLEKLVQMMESRQE